jgi:signal transduction histidine kinase
MPRPDRSIDMDEILSILRAVAGQLDFRAVIRAASSAIRDRLPHDHLDVALVNPDRTTVTAYETGLHTEWDAATTATKALDVSPIRDLLRDDVDHIVTDDAQSDPRFHFEGAFSTPIFAAGLRSRLHVPLKVEGRVIGALSFSTQEVGSYGPAEVASAKIVGDILSSYIFALQQSQLARQRELQQVEAEARAEGLRIGALHLTEELENARQAIGMDLHDQTLADLTRISRQLKRLGGRAALRGGELQPLQEDVDHCLRELRVIIDSAKPSVLQFFGFGQAVEAFLERSASMTTGDVEVGLVDDGTAGIDDLPQTTVVALYRIVQEAVNNALRHAEAKRLEVRLFRDPSDGRARIVVEDDGRGLPKTAGRRSGGLGNMRTRASLIRAEFSTGPGTGGAGTRLELILPETPANPPAPRSDGR